MQKRTRNLGIHTHSFASSSFLQLFSSCHSCHSNEKFWGIGRELNYCKTMWLHGGTLFVAVVMWINFHSCVGDRKRPGRRVGHRPSTTLRRLQHECKNILHENCSLFVAPTSLCPTNSTAVRLAPLPNNMHEWHFSFSGVPGSPYEGGIYHGRFLLPTDYPMRGPRVQLMTPNGRFATYKDICLSASSFHQESWSTHWTLHKLVAVLAGSVGADGSVRMFDFRTFARSNVRTFERSNVRKTVLH